MPRYMGESTLKALNVKSTDINRVLRDFFRRFENFFLINRVANTTQADTQLRAALLRQFVGDNALHAIPSEADDVTKTYDELKTALETRFQVKLDPLVLRSQFMRSVMLPGQSSRD